MLSLEQTMDALIEAASRGQKRQAQDSFLDLERFGSEVTEPLLPLLQHPDPSVRESTVAALGWGIRDERIVVPLIGALRDEDPAVRDMAVVRLGRAEHVAAVEPLIVMLDDESSSVRRSTLTALAWIRDQRCIGAIARVLRSSRDPSMASGAAACLATAGAYEELRDALLDGIAVDPGLAAMALVRTNDGRAFDFLISILESGGSHEGRVEEYLRQTAVLRLGELGDPRAICHLGKYATDPSSYLRYCAAWARVQLGDGSAVWDLVPLVASPDPMTRSSAALSLGRIRTPGVGDALLRLSESSDAKVRSSALFALSVREDARAIPHLITELRAGSVQVVHNLEHFNDERVVTALIEAVTAGSSDIRLWAIFALYRLGSRSALETILSTLGEYSYADYTASERPVGLYSIAALGRIGDPRAAEPISGYLHIQDASLRRMAAWALARISSSESDAALVQTLRCRDHDAICGAYDYYIGRGLQESEDALLTTLSRLGHLAMAEDYAGSGNAKLEEAGKAWLTNHPNATRDAEPPLCDYPPWRNRTGVTWGSR